MYLGFAGTLGASFRPRGDCCSLRRRFTWGNKRFFFKCAFVTRMRETGDASKHVGTGFGSEDDELSWYKGDSTQGTNLTPYDESHSDCISVVHRN